MIKEVLVVYLLQKLLGKERAEKLNAMAKKYITKTAAIIFGLIAIFHTFRFALDLDASVAGWDVPLWVSFIVAAIAGYLAFSLWKMK